MNCHTCSFARFFRNDKVYSAIQKNPDRAYKELKEKLAKKDISTQHNTVHKFGEDLFVIKGLSGIHVCDESFSYGCYHGFFSKAVAIHGLSAIYTLDRECSLWKYQDRCQYGIGHGILEFFGSDDRLVNALRECDNLSKKSKYARCSGGVYMEYNFRTTRARGKTNPRALTENNIHTPCFTLPIKYREDCYFYQPQWWDSVLDSDFHKIGSLCASLPEDNLQSACFKGSGNIIGPRQDFNLEKALAKCAEISDQRGIFYCKVGLARIFATGADKKREAQQICSQLPLNEAKQCIREMSM